MTHEYGKPLIGAALGEQRLFSSGDSAWETPWEPSEPDATATLWRYMSFAKFSSLLERRALFFSLVGEMADRYEGFIYPPLTPKSGDPLREAEDLVRDTLHKMARAALISCWTESGHESSLMWEAYAGTEGVAVRTTYQALQESICSVPELPITFGQVKYIDYRQQEVSRFGWAPLFHKRIEYRGEGEVRAVLPCPPSEDGDNLKVSRIRGRFISAVYVGLGCNTPSVVGEQDFHPLNVNGHRKCQGFDH